MSRKSCKRLQAVMLEEFRLLGTHPVLYENPRAILFMVDGEEFWVPKSCLHSDTKAAVNGAVRNDDIDIYVSIWWLEKQGRA